MVCRVGKRRLVTLSQGVRAPAWVLRDAAARPALLDIDWEGDRYWYAGRSYATAAELYAALGVVTVVSGRKITIGPNPSGAELVSGSVFDGSESISAWTAGPNTTLSYAGGGMRVTTGAGGTTAYGYQLITGLTIGKSYVLRAGGIGTLGDIRVGTTPDGNDVLINGSFGQNPPTGAGGSWSFFAATTSVYVTFRGTSTNGGTRTFSFCSVKESSLFAGWSNIGGTIVIKFLSASTLSAAENYMYITDRYGGGATIANEKIELTQSTTVGQMASSVRHLNVSGLSCTGDTVFPGSNTTVAIAWANADSQMSVNGQYNEGSSVSASGDIPSYLDRVHIGHNGIGTGQVQGTLRRWTYFPRRVPDISVRADWYDRHPDAIHTIGDSFCNTTYWVPAIKTAYPARKVSYDGVGGSALSEYDTQGAPPAPSLEKRLARTPALWDRTIVFMDGGISGPPRYEDVSTVLSRLIAMTTNNRWLYVQPSPGNKATGDAINSYSGQSNYLDWVSWLADARTVVPDGNYVDCLAALQAAGNGTTDNADVAAGCVPTSLLTDATPAKLHEGATAAGIRAGLVKAKTDADPSLLA